MSEQQQSAVPLLFRRHAPRPRLTRPLDETTAQAMLLVGPAGYGKTTLAAEWLQGRLDVAWYRATSGAADVAALSVGVAEAVQPLLPGAGDRLRQRLSVTEAPEKVVRTLAELLASDLEAWPDGAILVIDDYHLVADSAPVEEFVDWLLTLTPLRLLVTSRRRPSWASARRVLYGEVMEIGRDDLAMTTAEAAQILEGRSTEAVRALVAQAEGWPALIGLAAMSAAAEIPEERVADALLRYFAEEVFRQQPPEIQEFMLAASVPARFDRGLLIRIFDSPPSGAILERLVDEALLHRIDDSQFRFHHLFREFLRKKLEEESPESAQSLARRTIDLARESGEWDEALDEAVRGNHLALAAEVIGQAAPTYLLTGRLETLETWLAAIGPTAFEHPEAVLARVDVLIRKGRPLQARAVALDLVGRLSETSPLTSRAWRLAGQASHLLSLERDALAEHLTARRFARTTEDRKAALWGAFLAAAALEDSGATTLLNELAELAQSGSDDRLRLAAGKAELLAQVGSFAGMWDHLESLLPAAPHCTNPMTRSNFLSWAAYLNIARANYRKARELADEAVLVCIDLRLDFVTVPCLAHRAAAELGLRRLKAARNTRGQLEEVLRRLDVSPHNEAERLILDAKLALATGRAHRVLDQESSLTVADLPCAMRGALMGLQAIAAAVAGEGRLARDFARLATETSRAIEAKYYAAFGEVIAELERGMPIISAREKVNRLVIAAREAGFLDAFVVAYRAWPDLLVCAAGEPRALRIARECIATCNDRGLGKRAGIVAERELGVDTDNLSRREREVVELLRAGLTNEEIARRLYISPKTVKVHLRHIFEKLGVRSRLQAALAVEEQHDSE